jgi:hypothetical protein
VDKEQLERFAEPPEVLLDPGDYTLRIEEVQIADDRLSIRPLCMVVGGDSDGKKVCPETYDFHEGGENAAAIRNLYGWGVSEQELMSTGGDVTSIGALLEGRLGRVSLQQRESGIGEVVNTAQCSRLAILSRRARPSSEAGTSGSLVAAVASVSRNTSQAYGRPMSELARQARGGAPYRANVVLSPRKARSESALPWETEDHRRSARRPCAQLLCCEPVGDRKCCRRSRSRDRGPVWSQVPRLA